MMNAHTIVSLTQSSMTPAEGFENCLKVRETTPLNLVSHKLVQNPSR